MELTLSTGARLRVRPMPTHVMQQLGREEEAKIESAPQAPTRELRSPLTDAVENVPAGEGDPEYEEWLRAMEDWTVRTQEARAQINTRLVAIMFDYGIVEWCLKYDGEHPEKAVWASDVPSGWEFPPALMRHGLTASDNPRLDYIFIEVIPRPADYGAALRAIRAEFSPLSDEEVAAQLAGFRPPGRSEGAEGQGDTSVEVPRGTIGGKGMGLIARLLGRAKPR